jgi:hypothetical protein
MKKTTMVMMMGEARLLSNLEALFFSFGFLFVWEKENPSVIFFWYKTGIILFKRCRLCHAANRKNVE